MYPSPRSGPLESRRRESVTVQRRGIDETPRRGQARHPRRSHTRLLETALFVVVATWLPGWLGDSFGIPVFRWCGVISGYTGASWLLPGYLIGLAATRIARRRRLPLGGGLGVIVGTTAAILLLIGAGSAIGT